MDDSCGKPGNLADESLMIKAQTFAKDPRGGIILRRSRLGPQQ